jgi:GIY-YIG catalytic domain.
MCGIYKLTSNKCKLSYVGQAGRSLKQRYQEHIRCIKQNDPQSAYVLHILNNNHKYGPFNTNMTVLKQITIT